MIVDILTKDDLLELRQTLISDFKKLLNEVMKQQPDTLEGYKTKDVRRILGCSTNKLVSLRINRKIRVKKVGGTLYYNADDVKKLLLEGY
jgi:hypothetical protein